ncbi:uncharacterized protein PG998_011560 [Apiospora kogelbergensis]|uniref:uncharacterized protein n=1 Tax=Apiospora kogelbergensis TaxID=1337665 RepID=UPI00312DEFC5
MLNLRVIMKVSSLWFAVVQICSAAEVPGQKPLWSHEDTQTNIYAEPQIPDSQASPSKHGSWNGWGANVYNNRWASSDALIDTTNIQSLEPVSYYPTWSGLLVALDYATCTEVWTTNITSIVLAFRPITAQRGLLPPVSRTTPVSNADDGEESDVLFVGTLAHALVLAIDKQTGALIDTLQLDDHPFAGITQSPTFYAGRLYIGVSGIESAVPAVFPDYECCSFVGSMHAVELTPGRRRLGLRWTTSMAPEDRQGLNGAAVWGSQPSIDAFRSQLFIGTGQTYKLPKVFEECQNATADIEAIKQGRTAHDPCSPRDFHTTSVLALDLATGRINWARQMGPLDAWNVACVEVPGFPPNPAACPPTPGNDTDFGMAPTFVPGGAHTPGGEDVVVAGQKNGFLYAFSAQAGTVRWATAAGPGGIEGGLRWGVAVDDRAVYFVSSNSMRAPHTLPDGRVIAHSSFGAADLRDGSLLWATPAPEEAVSFMAPTVVNGVVLTGTTGAYAGSPGSTKPPGIFVALDKKTGKMLRKVTLDGHFQGGIAVVHDYVIFGTGYGKITATVPGSLQVWKIKSETSSRGRSAGEL